MNWLPVRGFGDRYEVSSTGRVRNLVTDRELVPQTNHGGYLRVYLRREDGTWCWRRVHVLVLEAHGPGGQRDNSVSNLRWALPEANEADKKLAGTVRGGGPKTPASSPEEIRRAAAAGESYSSIAARLGMHRHSVSRICRGLRHTRAA